MQEVISMAVTAEELNSFYSNLELWSKEQQIKAETISKSFSKLFESSGLNNIEERITQFFQSNRLISEEYYNQITNR